MRSIRVDFSVVCVLVLVSVVPLVASLIAVSADTPTVWSPYPVVSFALLLLPRWLALLIIPVGFVTLNVGMIRKDHRGGHLHLPIAMALLNVLSVAYFWVDLFEGIDHQGLSYSVVMVFVNVAIVLAFWLMWLLWRNAPSLSRSLALSLILSCWLVWFAFPHFGEGI